MRTSHRPKLPKLSPAYDDRRVGVKQYCRLQGQSTSLGVTLYNVVICPQAYQHWVPYGKRLHAGAVPAHRSHPSACSSFAAQTYHMDHSLHPAGSGKCSLQAAGSPHHGDAQQQHSLSCPSPDACRPLCTLHIHPYVITLMFDPAPSSSALWLSFAPTTPADCSHYASTGNKQVCDP